MYKYYFLHLYIKIEDKNITEKNYTDNNFSFKWIIYSWLGFENYNHFSSSVDF